MHFNYGKENSIYLPFMQDTLRDVFNEYTIFECINKSIYYTDIFQEHWLCNFDYSDQEDSIALKEPDDISTRHENIPLLSSRSSLKLRKDYDFALFSLKINPASFHFADEALKNEDRFVMEAISRNPKVFPFIDAKYKCDKKLVLEQVRVNPSAIYFCSPLLFFDADVYVSMLHMINVWKLVKNEAFVDIHFSFERFSHLKKKRIQ
jgi:hypothetical protein